MLNIFVELVTGFEGLQLDSASSQVRIVILLRVNI